jgi:hypothetical protein
VRCEQKPLDDVAAAAILAAKMAAGTLGMPGMQSLGQLGAMPATAGKNVMPAREPERDDLLD